jgi:hypothetical protein
VNRLGFRDPVLTARATPIYLLRNSFYSVAIVLAAASCTRASRKRPLAEPAQSPGNQISIQQSGVSGNRIALPSNEAGSKDFDYRHSTNCLDLVDETLEAEAWITAAAQACHPGSKKLGAGVSKIAEGDGQMTFAIPIGKKHRCWTAFAAVDQNLLPAQVEVIDKEGPIHAMGTLSKVRSAIPQSGPFCALQGDFSSVRLRLKQGSRGQASITFFSFD